MDSALIRRIVEAALLASPQPLSLNQLAGLFPEAEPPPPGGIEKALTELAEQNGQRGVNLVEVASGFRFQVDSELLPWVARLWAERPPRYSRALLETLALIAYRQPITRGEIEQIRGVAVSSHIIKTLEEREWIRVVGHRDVPGRPALFGTTRGFLDYFGLKSLDQLPPLTELQDLPDLEPELPLEGIAQDMSAAEAPANADSSQPAIDAAESAGADTPMAVEPEAPEPLRAQESGAAPVEAPAAEHADDVAADDPHDAGDTAPTQTPMPDAPSGDTDSQAGDDTAPEQKT